MSPKSKSQIRNARKSRATKNQTSGVNHSNKLQQELNRCLKENKDMVTRVSQLEIAKTMLIKMTPGSPGYDPNWKPSAASEPPKLDEKYVKVPTAAEVALDSVTNMLSAAGTIGIGDGKHFRSTDEMVKNLKKVKEAIITPQKTLVNRIGIHPLVFQNLLNHFGKHSKGSHGHKHLLDVRMAGPAYDEKCAPNKQPEMVPFECDVDLLKGIMRSGMGDKPMAVKLSVNFAIQTSTAGLAQAPVFRLRPSDSAEFSSLATLFDLYKAVNQTSHVYFARSGVASTVDAFWATAYDPISSGAYSNVQSIIIAAHHWGPFGTGQSGAIFNTWASHTGFFPMHCAVPEGPAYEYGVTTSIGTGVWTDCQVTAVDYGYLKSYVGALGGTDTSTIKVYMVMEVLFKCRT